LLFPLSEEPCQDCGEFPVFGKGFRASTSGAGGGVGPRFRQGSKLRLGVHDLLDDGEQVEGAAREAVNPFTVTTSPGARAFSIFRSSRRSLCAPVTFSR
jgi:hypothetical protein